MANGYGIDIGTGNLKVYNKSTATITCEKNTIAIVSGNRMYAYGNEAYSMYEKAPENISVSFPVISGVIADFDNMQSMLIEVIETQLQGKIKGADLLVAVPNDITEVEKKAFYDLFAKTKLKPRSILLCEKPLADAIGLGLDVTLPTGIMVTDIGADTTEISVISLGGMVISQLLPIGGNRFDEAIRTYIRRHYNLVIGLKSAKNLKETIGSAVGGCTESMKIVGRDVASGLPTEMEISADTVYEGIKDELDNLSTNLKLILEKVPPELARDIVNSGIYITGGTAGLKGLSEYLNGITNIKINIAEDAKNTVAAGLGNVLSDEKFAAFGYTLKSRVFS